MAHKKHSTHTKGGDLGADLAKLSVPFGILLAQKGLRQYLDVQKKTAPASTSAPKPKTSIKPATVGGAAKKTKVVTKKEKKPVGAKSMAKTTMKKS